jgi:hypothetical protein
VSAGIAPTGWQPPAEFSQQGLLIGQKDGNAYIQFTENGINMAFGQTTIAFSASGMSVTEDGVEYDFVTHIHPTPMGPSSQQTPV